MSVNRVNPVFNRRIFLQGMGAGAAAMITAHLLQGQALASAPVSGDQWGMLIDLTRCVGCNSCPLACKTINRLPDAETPPTALSNTAFTFLDERVVSEADGATGQRHVKRQCMHCLDAACVAACPAAAMYKSDEGPVIYRPERCLGCRYCQIACPFGVPSFDWQNGLTPVISKCWFCYQRLGAGEQPACAAACPTGALRFGKRAELLAQAHAQIASAPDRYIDHVFGEHEVGGTSVLYLSDIPFAELGFPVDLPTVAPPEQASKVMNVLPGVILGTATVVTGAATITHRRKHSDPESTEEA